MCLNLLHVALAHKRNGREKTVRCKIDGDPHFGRGATFDPTRVTLTFEKILTIVNFDLNNAIFTTGECTMRQQVGIPMGSPLSPSLAQIVCAFYEHRTLRRARILGYDNPVVGFRYVDGLTALIFHSGGSSLADAREVARLIQFGYHKDMELEVEDTTLPFKFLSSMLRVNMKTGKIDASFHNKNQAALDRESKQEFATYQHFHSFAPKSPKSLGCDIELAADRRSMQFI